MSEHESPAPQTVTTRVVITDIHIPFRSIVRLLFKIIIALIPVLLILGIVAVIFVPILFAMAMEAFRVMLLAPFGGT